MAERDILDVRWGNGKPMGQRLVLSIWGLKDYDLSEVFVEPEEQEILNLIRENPKEYSLHITRKVDVE